MYSPIYFLIIMFFTNVAYSKVCEPKIIKHESEIQEKVKICDRGDKILITYDIKVNTEKLIVKLCDIKYPLISRDETKTIHKRNSGLSIICIFDPNF